MKKNSIQKKMKLFKLTNYAFISVCLLILFMTSWSAASMTILPDTELKNLNAYTNSHNLLSNKLMDKQRRIVKNNTIYSGAVSFSTRQDGSKQKTFTNINMDINVFGSIGKLYLAKYPTNQQSGAHLIWPLNYQFNEVAWLSPWDSEYRSIQIGNESSPFQLRGLQIRNDFIYTQEGKVLNRFVIGSDNVSGQIHIVAAKSFTGLLNTSIAVDSIELVEWMPPGWISRSYILNGESHDTTEDMLKGMLGNVGQKGFEFSNHGLGIMMDSDYGVGVWAGFPLSDIDLY